MAHNNNYDVTVDEAATEDHLPALSAGLRLNNQPRCYPYGRRSWADRPDIVMRALNIASRHTTEIEYVPDRDLSKVALTRSHQATLRELCCNLRIPPPGYSTDELLARDDGVAALAWMMLRAYNVVNYDLNNEILEEAQVGTKNSIPRTLAGIGSS
ncbi:hypothetical protein PIB30_000486 [Stylosanthes scabra]|uniref:Uncharacterized protein n=1 Tax=Stylosanthes scabra TaxID=79078 RepID=A0ABU6W1Z3_9FABA|nr:hypothetical protein [Stylosanthes scabra]